jgi:hypothetical protein
MNKAVDSLFVLLQCGYERYSKDYLSLENHLNICQDAEQELGIDHLLLMEQIAFLKNEADENPGASDECYAAIKQLKRDIKNKQKLKALGNEQLRAAKIAFAKEGAKPENSKAKGQPLRAKLEELLRVGFCIDKGVYFGGDLQGAACRKLMTDRKEIFSAIKVLLASEEQSLIVCPLKVWEMLDAYERLFGHFDAIFSVCRIKRYHLTTNDMVFLRAHVTHVMALWRAVGLSISPKMHCVEDHLCNIVEFFCGVGDLGEDEGERAHQTGHRLEIRSKSLRDHEKKAKSHIKLEAMNQNPQVRECQSFIEEQAKRRNKRQGLSIGENSAKKAKLERKMGRQCLLNLPIVETPVTSLLHLRKVALKQKYGSSIEYYYFTASSQLFSKVILLLLLLLLQPPMMPLVQQQESVVHQKGYS